MTSHRDAELVGGDWERSSSIGLSRLMRRSWESFRDALCNSWTPGVAEPELAGARVSMACRKNEREGK
jgi:hypothetical protein